MLVRVTDGSTGETEWVGPAKALVRANDGDEAVADAVAAVEAGAAGAGAGAAGAGAGFSWITPLDVTNGAVGDERVALDQQEDGTFVLLTNGNPVPLYEGDWGFLDLMDAEGMRADVTAALALIVEYAGDDEARDAATWALDQLEQ